MYQEIKPKTHEQEEILRGLQRLPTNKAVLLYSGGADSTAAGLKLREQGFSVYPFTVDYGQTAREAELHLARTSAESLGFEPPFFIEMADVMLALSNSALLGGDAVDDTNAWVPARNTIFMVLAGSYAYQVDADGIAVGFMAEDSGVFGDSNLIHHRITGTLLTQSLSRPMDVFTPLMSMTKLDVLRYLVENDALDKTVSCWNAALEDGVVSACHGCANCIERDTNLRILVEKYAQELPLEQQATVNAIR